MDDALRDGQTNTRTLEFAGLMESVERGVEFVRIIHIEAGSVVTHEIGGSVARYLSSEFDTRGFPVPREFPGIGNEVFQIVQPDLFYFGGMIRTMKVARMAQAVGLNRRLGTCCCFFFILFFLSLLLAVFT